MTQLATPTLEVIAFSYEPRYPYLTWTVRCGYGTEWVHHGSLWRHFFHCIRGGISERAILTEERYFYRRDKELFGDEIADQLRSPLTERIKRLAQKDTWL